MYFVFSSFRIFPSENHALEYLIYEPYCHNISLKSHIYGASCLEEKNTFEIQEYYNSISRKSIFRKVHLLFSRLKCQFLRQNQPLKDSRIMTNPRNVLKTIVKQEFFANFQPFLFLQFLTINSSDIIADILSQFPPIIWRAFWFYEKNLVFISSMLLCLYIYMIKHILALWMLRPLQR